jgi:hypothetical protein
VNLGRRLATLLLASCAALALGTVAATPAAATDGTIIVDN